MRFSKFILQNWPPIINGYLVRSPQSGRLSNYFSQYLHYLLCNYVQLHDNYFFHQELECNEYVRKLDYLIGKGDGLQYFKGKEAKNIRWIALIESQWGNNNKKKINDYLNVDFPKLIEWESKYRDQVKIALLDMTGHSGNWLTNHQNMIRSLRAKAKYDVKSRYMVLITSRKLKEKIIGYTVADRWKIKLEKTINYT